MAMESMSEDAHALSTDYPEDDPLHDFSDEELFHLVEETEQANQVLEAETRMFEKYLHRVEPRDAAPRSVIAVGSSHSGRDELHLRTTQRKRSKSRGSNMDRLQKLTAEQKCDIAQRELEELREEMEKLKEESEKVLDTYKAILEEADMRLAETKKESYEFERDIVKGSVSDHSTKVIAEKVIRYFEDRIRARDTLIEKLRLKNATLKLHKKKMHLQLKQKEEMGEVLHEVDFNQLKIENQQYLEKIDERNQDLLRLKLMAGNTLQVLNSYKKKLNTLTMESERLETEIQSRNDILSKIDSETLLVENERAKAEKINRHLRKQLSDYRVPDVMEYVQEKAELYEIQKKVKSWERKVEIAEMALRTHRKTWRQMQFGSQHGPTAVWPMLPAS